MTPRPDQPPIRLAYADGEAGQIHYARCGPAHAPTVLLLHQTPRSWREFEFVLPLLGSHFDAVAMDTLGFGGSSAPVPTAEPGARTAGTGTASVERWAQGAVDLLDALAIDRAHVVGHHTGGVIAVEVAASRPDRVDRLVLSSTPYTDETFRRARAQHPPVDAVELGGDGSHLVALWQGRQSFYPEARLDLLHALVRDALQVDDPAAGHRAVADYRMEDRIGEVTAPTLVIRATDDPFASPHADTLADQLVDARVVDIVGGTVPLPDHLPERFAAVVMAFLADDQLEADT